MSRNSKLRAICSTAQSYWYSFYRGLKGYWGRWGDAGFHLVLAGWIAASLYLASVDTANQLELHQRMDMFLGDSNRVTLEDVENALRSQRVVMAGSEERLTDLIQAECGTGSYDYYGDSEGTTDAARGAASENVPVY